MLSNVATIVPIAALFEVEVDKRKGNRLQIMRTTKTKAITFLTTIIATGLMAGTAFAGSGNTMSPYAAGANTINVMLPEAIKVGHKTLPPGKYQISEIALGSALSSFLFRDDSGNTAAILEATRTASPSKVDLSGAVEKTELLLSSSEDGTVRLNKLFIEGQVSGFRFVNLK